MHFIEGNLQQFGWPAGIFFMDLHSVFEFNRLEVAHIGLSRC